MKNPCMDCGTPADATRCDRCEDSFNRVRNRQATLRRASNGGSPYDTGPYRAAAKLVRLNATRCHICKQGPRANDPWQADHIIPVFKGGGVGPLAPAHRSCNIARANKLRATQPTDIASNTRKSNGGGGQGGHTPTSPNATPPHTTHGTQT